MVNSSEIKQMTVDAVDEFSSLVRLNDDWTAMPSDQTEEKACHSCSTLVGDSSSLWPLCEIVGTRNDVSISRVGAIERADEINANSMKGAIGCKVAAVFVNFLFTLWHASHVLM